MHDLADMQLDVAIKIMCFTLSREGADGPRVQSDTAVRAVGLLPAQAAPTGDVASARNAGIQEANAADTASASAADSTTAGLNGFVPHS